MIDSTSQYQTFQARRAVLAGLIERAERVFRALDMSTWAEASQKLAVRVENDRFRVMILGEFKRGKSTFINALLRAEVLPADIAPCTAVINEVKWGEPAKALLHFRQPVPEKMPPLPADAKRHLDKHKGGVIPAMEIPVSDLPEFVKIPDPAVDQAASVAATPYDRVELFWPLALCRNGVEIIDSPGLNEHHTRTKTTRDYLAFIDAVVFVMSVHALAGESELAVIDNDLRPSGHEYLFFVCNRFDELRKREDREKIMSYAFTKLADRTKFGREGVFFLSAIDALEGQLDGDAGKVSRSGIVPLEKALERFLVEDRGRVKLLQPAGNLARGLRAALSEVVPARRKMLDEDVTSLRKRLDEAKPLLDQAAKRRDNVLKQVEAARLRVRDTVRREAERFFSDLAQDIPIWARRLTVQSTINPLKVWAVRAQSEAVAKEVLVGLQKMVDAEAEKWSRTQLAPLVDQQMSELAESLNTTLEPFLEYLEGVKSRLTGELHRPAVDVGGTPMLGKVLAGTGGALLGAGIVAGAIVPHVAIASIGLSGVVSVIMAKVWALALSMVNPVTMAGALVAVLILNERRGEALTNQVKVQVAETLAAQLRQLARDQSVAIANEVHCQTEALADGISEGLDRELRQVREQVDAVIREKDQGEAEVEKQRKSLAVQEATLRTVADDLNDLILSLG